MSHDKITTAARKRMAETGESYAAARRAVIRERQQAGRGTPPGSTPPSGQIPPSGAQWFTISYGDDWSARITDSMDRLLFRAGRGVSRVEVDAAEIRVRMGSFKLDIPRGSVQSIQRSWAKVGRTTGVHGGRGRWLVNGSAEGLVELALDPPGRVSPSIDTMYGLGPSRVKQLTVSLDDPGGFIAAVENP